LIIVGFQTPPPSAEGVDPYHCTGHEEYNWRHEEAILNKLPQYRCAVPIDGFGPLRHHFLWHRSLPQHHAESSESSGSTKGAPLTPHKPHHPLLLVGEFWEYLRLFRELASSSGFDVVCPSVPGMGFSDSPSHRGFGIKKAAEGLHILMNRLGYTEYIIHCSGYLGYALARMLSILYPQSIKGIHITDAVLQPPTWGRMPGKKLKLQCSKMFGTPWSKDEVQRISTVRSARDPGLDDQSGKSWQQKLVWEYALTDSPMGLLSWVVGRIRKGATSKYTWTYSEILTAFMYYWISGPRDFMRILETSRKLGELDMIAQAHSTVPIGIFIPSDRRLPADYLEMIGKVVQETTPKVAGRWVAWEIPHDLAEAVRKFWAVIEGMKPPITRRPPIAEKSSDQSERSS